MEKDEMIQVRLNKDLKKDLLELAKNERRNLSDYVRILLEDHVKMKEAKKKPS